MLPPPVPCPMSIESTLRYAVPCSWGLLEHLLEATPQLGWGGLLWMQNILYKPLKGWIFFKFHGIYTLIKPCLHITAGHSDSYINWHLGPHEKTHTTEGTFMTQVFSCESGLIDANYPCTHMDFTYMRHQYKMGCTGSSMQLGTTGRPKTCGHCAPGDTIAWVPCLGWAILQGWTDKTGLCQGTYWHPFGSRVLSKLSLAWGVRLYEGERQNSCSMILLAVLLATACSNQMNQPWKAGCCGL